MGEIVTDHSKLKRRIRGLKEEEQRIIFTNGCFNILHVGHLRYLRDASELGDVLVVAVNGDESVQQLKGENYPVLPAEERVELLAALEFVDFVTIFHETDVSNLLLTLKPHVHAKGSDYSEDTIPERETVKSYGGELAVTGGPKNHSVTDILELIANWDRQRRE